MPHLIDSDWLIDYLDGEAHAVATIDALIPAGVAISIVTGIVTLTEKKRKRGRRAPHLPDQARQSEPPQCDLYAS